MAVVLFLSAFFCLVIALLIMPIHVRINPDREDGYREKPGFFRLNIDLDGESYISVILNVFFLRLRWHPLHKKGNKPAKRKASERKRKYYPWNPNRLKFLVNVAWQAVKKSKLKRLYMDLDTSNVIINANLYPVFELMNERPRINLNVNYAGNFALSLDVQNNLWILFRILIWNLLKRAFIFTKNK